MRPLTWPSPEVQLRHSYTTSILEQFVLSHSFGDVLRELAQNEYDAGGRQLVVRFGEASLQVTGNGKPIDAKGWSRLSVTLGTGVEHGTGRRIEEKTNGLGSKNFGLRSLFLFGNQILIRSGGRWTILDAERGTPETPLPDPETGDRPGVVIEVPYRTQALGKLEPFGPDREEQAFASIVRDLSLTVLKLDHPAASKRLSEIVVSSDRQDRKVSWRQSASEMATRAPGITAVRRVVRMQDMSPSNRQARPLIVEEVEFQRTCRLPERFRGRQVAGYYRVSGGRIRLGVSLAMKRKRIDPNHQGRFFYPLGALQAYTGTGVSVSAPFEMNNDRSQIVSPEVNDWNAWLLEQAACLTTDLLVDDWFERFGADAFVAAGEEREQLASAYSKGVVERLQTQSVWPARVTTGKRVLRPEFKGAAEVTFPVRHEFDGFLGEKNSLDFRLTSDARVQAIAERCKIPLFTTNSLVRLRCAGKDCSRLDTKIPAGEANYHYPQFPAALQSLDLQVRLSRALDAAHPDLRAEHRRDLRSTDTTLTAANTLAPASGLRAIPPNLAEACPVPPEKRLHPELVQFREIVGLCRQFKVQDWCREVAEQSERGVATAVEREALYRYLISSERKLNQKTWDYLRRFPVLRDHRGEWVSPAAITVPKAPGASLLEAALRYPARAYAQDQELAKRFRFRTRVTEDDVARYAEIVAQRPLLAEDLESALVKLKRLLNPALITRLKRIEFLQSSRGALAAPQSLYIRTRHLEQCLGPDAAYAAGKRTGLYEVLGCRQQPRTADVLEYLATLRAARMAPPHAEVLYPALVSAIAADKVPEDQYQNTPILWNGSGYSTPAETLAGQFQNRFLSSVPQVSGLSPSVMRAYVALGAQREPKPEHSLRLLLWIAERYAGETRAVTPVERQALRSAYQSLRELASAVPPTARCLLDEAGKLHDRSEVAAGRYLIGDDRRTAEACLEQNIPVAFADTNDRSLRFFERIGVRRLSTIRRRKTFSTGIVKPPSAELRVQTVLARLHSPDLASALTTLVNWEYPDRIPPDERRLRSKLQALEEIVVSEPLELHYDIAGHDVRVPADAVLEGRRIIVSGGRSVLQVCGMLAHPIADLLIDTPQEQRVVADAVFRLLTESTSDGIQRYLESRGVPWKPTECREQEGEETASDAEERESEAEQVRSLLGSTLTASLGDAPPPDAPPSLTNVGEPAGDGPGSPVPPPASPSLPPLPPIDSVVIREAEASASWQPSAERKGNTPRGGYWSTSRRNEEQDRRIGDRGEELIFRREQERVRRLGLPAERVIWVSRTFPNADHDIQSVDEDGETCWIEVKATTGQDGKFQWPKSEFERALHARSRYVLVRVYQADTTSPVVKEFRDPVGMFLNKGMRLDTASLWGEVEPLG